MTDIAWYTGVTVNFILVVTLSILVVNRSLKTDRRTIPTRLQIDTLMSLAGLVVTSTGTMLLYLLQGFLQCDLTDTDTLFPIMLWVGYYVTVTGFLGVLLVQSVGNRKHELLIQGSILTAFIFLGLGMLDYTCFWNEGAIQVVFHNALADASGTFLSMGIAVLGLSMTVLQRLDFVDSNSTDDHGSMDRITSCILIASFFFALQFAVPRASMESVTNPFSVKLVGLFIILGFAYYLSEYFRAASSAELPRLHVLDETDRNKAISNRDLMTIGLATVAIMVYVFLMRLDISVLSVHEKIELGLPIFYVGQWRDDALYIDPVGCILPVVAAITIVVVISIRYRVWRVPDAFVLLAVLTSVILSFAASLVVYFTSNPLVTDYQPTFSVIPFIVSSLLAWVFMTNLSEYYSFPSSKHESRRNPRAEYLGPALVFAGNTFAALLFDFTIAESPFGVVQIGGAGFLDGLIWAPLLSALILSVFIVFRRLLGFESQDAAIQPSSQAGSSP